MENARKELSNIPALTHQDASILRTVIDKMCKMQRDIDFAIHLLLQPVQSLKKKDVMRLMEDLKRLRMEADLTFSPTQVKQQ